MKLMYNNNSNSNSNNNNNIDHFLQKSPEEPFFMLTFEQQQNLHQFGREEEIECSVLINKPIFVWWICRDIHPCFVCCPDLVWLQESERIDVTAL